MTSNRRERTADLTKAVKDLVTLHGGYAFRNNNQPRIDPKTHRAFYPDKSIVGSPDIIAIMPHGVTLWIEIKVSPDKMRDTQLQFMGELVKRDHVYIVVQDSVDGLQEYLEASKDADQAREGREER